MRTGITTVIRVFSILSVKNDGLNKTRSPLYIIDHRITHIFLIKKIRYNLKEKKGVM